jgi:hypothetical protein
MAGALTRRFTKLSLKQVLAIVASFVAIYMVSAHHKALQYWFAPPKKAAGKPAATAAATPIGAKSS